MRLLNLASPPPSAPNPTPISLAPYARSPQFRKWCPLGGGAVAVDQAGAAAAQLVADFKIGSPVRYPILVISYELYRRVFPCCLGAQCPRGPITTTKYRARSLSNRVVLHALLLAYVDAICLLRGPLSAPLCFALRSERRGAAISSVRAYIREPADGEVVQSRNAHPVYAALACSFCKAAELYGTLDGRHFLRNNLLRHKLVLCPGNFCVCVLVFPHEASRDRNRSGMGH